MILVTVGTTPFPFRRMNSIVRQLAELREGQEQILYQYGATDIGNIERIHNLKLVSSLPFGTLIAAIAKARLIVCHGGPATIFQVLDAGKIPVVLPRDRRFGEHVNAHQIRFSRFMKKKGLIRLWPDIGSGDQLKSRVGLSRVEPVVAYLNSLIP